MKNHKEKIIVEHPLGCKCERCKGYLLGYRHGFKTCEKLNDNKVMKAREEELIKFKEYLEFLLSNRLHPEYSIKDLRIEIADQLGLVYSRITRLNK